MLATDSLLALVGKEDDEKARPAAALLAAWLHYQLPMELY